MSESWRNDSVYRDGSLNYGRLALYAIMIFVAIIWGAPFIWMFVTSIKPDNEVFQLPAHLVARRADAGILHAAL